MKRCLTIFAPFVVVASLAPFGTQAQPSVAPFPSRLHAAAARGDLNAVLEALGSGENVDRRDNHGRTALLLAVEGGHTGIARALMERGGSVNAQASNQDTPWLLAGALGRTDILDLMLAREPDLSIRNRFGGNALIPACEQGHVDTVRLLTTKSRIDVNHINNLGWTCLLEIVILGDGGRRHQDATRLVMAAGADPNISDKEGVTPLAHARRRGQLGIAMLIETAGGR